MDGFKKSRSSAFKDKTSSAIAVSWAMPSSSQQPQQPFGIKTLHEDENSTIDLGGLVCQDALCYASQSHEPHLKQVLHCTRGIAFLGTPHGGPALAHCAKGFLQRDFELLARVQDSFITLVQLRSRPSELGPTINITCFVEGLPLDGVGQVVPQDAIIPGCIPIRIRDNHMDMTKFEDSNDAGFVAVAGQLSRWCEEVSSPPLERAHTILADGQGLGVGPETQSVRGIGGIANAAGTSTTSSREACNMIPFDRNPKFVGREDVIQEIDRQFESQREVALCGFGGAGKSQIAIEYAYRFRQRHPDAHILWVDGSSVFRTDPKYFPIVKKLDLLPLNRMIFNSCAFKLVCEALSNGMCGRWLLVLDNLDDMKMLGRMVGLPWEMDIEEATKPPPKAYLPRSPKGLTLITTRSDSVGNSLTGMRITKIGPMDESDALSLLRSCLAPDAMSDLNDCLELVKALDYVPLAIKQAAAFLRHTGVSLGLYLNRFRNIHGEMSSLTEEEEKDSRGDFESRCSIFRTLKISFDWISQTRPRTAEIFRLMAALDRQGIPKRLLKRNTEREADFNQSLGGLKNFSLISATKGQGDLGMHRLVQLAVRSWTRSDQERSRYQDEALEIMAREFPHVTCDNEALCQALIPQAWVVVQYKTSEMTRPRTRLLQNVGIYMMRISLYNVAFDALSEALRLQSNFVDLDKNTEALKPKNYTERSWSAVERC
ncbi:hypothetical protein MHUMG1_10221 [Metarhizium humberi]|uniref:NB-ARC domain-containing protein n=1 Tax=Metarhizium humberi TaxID=2596975 RepID=A0A9P8M1Q8_9HYPO|nr:hypothetical protein MHUMG1_10221 [Metarhizium humberi]